MLIRVTWVNGSQSELEMTTLRELDTFVGQHQQPGVEADLRPCDDAIGLQFKESPAAASPAEPR